MQEEQITKRILVKRALSAQSPEDFWGVGIVTRLNGLSKQRMDVIVGILARSLEHAGSASERYTLSMAYSQALLFYKWAEEKIAAGNYGDEHQFRLRLDLKVVTESEDKSDYSLYKFALQDGQQIIFSNPEISALWFAGEPHSDHYSLRHERGEYSYGKIEMYGTHAKRQYFLEKIPSFSRVPDMTAGRLTLGHVLRIETWEYGSIAEFLERNKN